MRSTLQEKLSLYWSSIITGGKAYWDFSEETQLGLVPSKMQYALWKVGVPPKGIISCQKAHLYELPSSHVPHQLSPWLGTIQQHHMTFGPTNWVCWTYSLGSGNYPGTGRSQETYTSKWISIWSLHIEFAWFIPYYTKLDEAARLGSQMLHSTEGLTLNFGCTANMYSSRGFLSCCDIFCYFCSPLGFIGKVEQDSNCSIISNCRTRRIFS